MNYIADAHRDWHTMAAAEGTPEAMCPWDCGAGEVYPNCDDCYDSDPACPTCAAVLGQPAEQIGPGHPLPQRVIDALFTTEV